MIGIVHSPIRAALLLVCLGLPKAAVAQVADSLAGRFEYDASAPLDLRVHGDTVLGSIRVRDVSYASPRGGRVSGYLVVPGGAGPHAAVLFMHPGQGDRSTFLEEARELAEAGVVSLLIDAPFARPPAWRPPNAGGDLAADLVHLIVDLRRGIDVLARQPMVEPTRIGFVGHSLGATAGGVLVGLGPRLRVAVLMAGFASHSGWWRASDHPFAADARRRIPPDRLARQIAALEPLDAVHYLSHAAPTELFFQFARQDEYITVGDAGRSFATASSPKTQRWYDTDHFFDAAARADRRAWLLERLGLER